MWLLVHEFHDDDNSYYRCKGWDIHDFAMIIVDIINIYVVEVIIHQVDTDNG